MTASAAGAPATVVVGGGVAGCAVALALSEAGATVTLVDRGHPGAATPASAGMLAPQYESDARGPLFRFAVRARDAWPGFAARVEALAGLPVGLRRRGMLVVNADADEHAAAREMARRQRGAGLAAEVLDPEGARELQPALTPDLYSCLWLPDEGQVDAQLLARALLPAVRAAGARVLAGEARRLLSTDGAVRGVELDDGTRLEGDRIVVAGGAWSGRLEGLPRRLPVGPVRGQMLRFAPDAAPVRRLLADHDGRYLVPRDDGSVLAGATMEDAGFEVAVTADGLGDVREAAARLLPGLREGREVGSWAGLRPVAPDGLPVLGAEPDLAGLLYATAFGRNGILLAPLAGRELARLALEGGPEAALAPFRPDRFG